LIDNLQYYAPILKPISEWFYNFGSEDGGMYVEMKGLDLNNRPRTRIWYIKASLGHGISIPAMPAAIVASKLAQGTLKATGAVPCMGLFQLKEFDKIATGFSIKTASVAY
jgi:hypothetical protein